MEALKLVPLANVERVPGSDGDVWKFSNGDPQFELKLVLDGATLPAGWHELTLNMRPIEGGIDSPTLYPDYGSGCTEFESIPLRMPDATGSVRMVVRLKYPPHVLRFDPSTADAVVGFGGAGIRRLGKASAMLKMLSHVAGSPQGGFREAAALFARTIRHIVKGGSTEAGENLYARYQQLICQNSFDYGEWTRDHSAPLAAEDAAKLLASLDLKPLVSVVMPTYNTPERWLRAAIDSVLRQSYPHWELCIADDASTARHLRRVLNEYATRDRRIRVVFREKNGHISAASNSALEIATGDWIALLDHDDELHPDALLRIAEAIDANPDAQLVYSDEDKVDETGRRYQPYFKPAFDADLLLGQNYICHLGAYRKDTVVALGGFRLGFEGSQDWDLALRVSGATSAGNVIHVPRVLYHWRAIQGSTALAGSEKSYTATAGMRAVEEHLARSKVRGMIEILTGGHLRVRREIPDPAPSVAIVIPTRDRVDLLRQCVASVLERTRYPHYQIVIVDNDSAEAQTLRYFEEVVADPRVTVLPYPHPFNYSAINNAAVASTEAEVVVLLNNDIEVISEDWLGEMVAHAVRPEVGAVGAMLYYPDDTVQHAGVTVGVGGVAGHAFTGAVRGSGGYMGRMRLTQRMLAVTAACLAVRRSIWDEVGGLDEGLRVAFNDVDFCLRVEARGYRNLWTPNAELYHHESASRGYENTPEKRLRFKSEVDFMVERWGERLTLDPSYNPNLSLKQAPFSLAFPPRCRQPRNSAFG